MRPKYNPGDIVEIAEMPKNVTSSDYPYHFALEMREEAGKKVQIIQVCRMMSSKTYPSMYTEPYYYICNIVMGEEYVSNKFAHYLSNYKWVETEFVQFPNGLPVISIF